MRIVPRDTKSAKYHKWRKPFIELLESKNIEIDEAIVKYIYSFDYTLQGSLKLYKQIYYKIHRYENTIHTVVTNKIINMVYKASSTISNIIYNNENSSSSEK